MKGFITVGSLLLLFVFGFAYLFKLYMLRSRHNLKANVLANKNKVKRIQRVEKSLQVTTLIWLLTWIGESILLQFGYENTLKLWDSVSISALGLIIIALGITFFIVAATAMKDSWRVGIDKNTKSKLITEGIYKYSRNPAFVGFYLMFIGLFTVYADIITCVVMLLNIYTMNRLVIEEEKHLEEMFGEEYTDYKRQTPRYILW